MAIERRDRPERCDPSERRFQVAGALGFGAATGDVGWGVIVGPAGTLAVGLCYLLGLAFSWRVLGRAGDASRATAVQSSAA
jgi:hypothetical protein